MLYQFAEVRGLKRYIWTVPVKASKFSTRWLNFVTSTSFQLAKRLVESMKSDVIPAEHNLDQLLDIQLLKYKEGMG